MKMNLYYVVRIYEGGTDSIGRSDDCQYIAGPFGSYSHALGAKGSHIVPTSSNLEIVEQLVEVE